MRTNVKPHYIPARTHEGAVAQHINNEASLRRTLMTCLLWEDSFYEDRVSTASRIASLTLGVKPEVAANLARQARNDMKLRHAPLWIARALAAGNKEQKAVVAGLLFDIIQRPDELTEFLSLYWQTGKSPISAAVKRGLAKAFTKFNAYSLAKYNRSEEIKLRDVLFLTHAKPRDAEQAAIWKQLVDGTLPVPDTWEVELSASKDKLGSWTRLLNENKLGALALLRNLRNMTQIGVDNNLIRFALNNCNAERALPFRFISAAKYAPNFEPELEQLMFKSIAGQPKLTGRTALIIDTSPSMWMSKVSAKSEMDRFEAAAALAILCREICDDVRVYAFNTKGYVVAPRRGFALRDAIAQTKDSASCGNAALHLAAKDGYDRVIVITDGEWHSWIPETGMQSNCAAHAKDIIMQPLTDKAYLINIGTYENRIGSGKWNHIDGWSEAIITYIQAMEQLPMN